MTDHYDIIIIGAGPIGLACGIEAKKRGFESIIIEKGCLTYSIYNYPANMRFFSSPELLEIGGIPFITANEKPVRREALEYYRRVADTYRLDIHLFEEALQVEGKRGNYTLRTNKDIYTTARIIIATGFYHKPRMLQVPGEDLPKVQHFYNEPHLYAQQDLLIVGSGNSAAQAALECHRHGAHVTIAIRGAGFKEGVKYWILPDIENRIKENQIKGFFHTTVKEIHPDDVLLQTKEGKTIHLTNDFVLALTGYEPDYDFLTRMGINIENSPNRAPVHNPDTYETNRPGIYLAGVVVGGLLTNVWFIENSRIHAPTIFDHIERRRR